MLLWVLHVNAGLHASARHAGVAINAHLQQVMPPLLALASSESTAPGPVAAREAINKIVAAVAEDGLYLLIAQVAAVLRPNLHAFKCRANMVLRVQTYLQCM